MDIGTRKPTVLVSLEPRCYREAIGDALKAMRPGLDVRVVEPTEVQEEAYRSRPGLVLSGSTDGLSDREAGTLWVQVVFPAEPGTRVRIGDGPVSRLQTFGLEDLLEIVDRVTGRGHA